MKVKNVIVCLIIIFCGGCMSLKIVESENRDIKPTNIELGNNITLTAIGEININKTDFYPSGCLIESKGVVIYIDPVEIINPKPADYIFISHNHPDHFSISDINKIVTKNTLIICPKKVAKKLKGLNVKEMKPGESFSLNNIKIETIKAFNTKPIFLWMYAHPESAENLGYILTIDGTRIYYAGDTDFIPEMKLLKDISVALIPIDGDKLTMDPIQAVEAVQVINPSLVIPVHYVVDKNGHSEKLEEFTKLINNKYNINILHNQKNNID